MEHTKKSGRASRKKIRGFGRKNHKILGLVDPNKVRVKESKVKDPTFVFTLEMSDGSPFNCIISGGATLTPVADYQTQPFDSGGLVTASEKQFSATFNDNNFQHENEFSYEIDLALTVPDAGGAPLTKKLTGTTFKVIP
ncbi:MAG: hypothetical protein IT260_13425 [Saprospiraceae bacterium]|nr:hypothetical protein [Saprospiraceae bacterium]